MINEFNRESVTKEFSDFGFIESKDIEEPVKLMEGQESIKLKLVICKKTKDLNQLSTEELGKLFPIRISEHNPEWKNTQK